MVTLDLDLIFYFLVLIIGTVMGATGMVAVHLSKHDGRGRKVAWNVFIAGMVLIAVSAFLR